MGAALPERPGENAALFCFNFIPAAFLVSVGVVDYEGVVDR